MNKKESKKSKTFIGSKKHLRNIKMEKDICKRCGGIKVHNFRELEKIMRFEKFCKCWVEKINPNYRLKK